MNEIDGQAGLSAYIGIPERTLTQWRYRNEGPPYIKVGHAVKYRKVDVDRWLEERTVTPPNIRR